MRNVLQRVVMQLLRAYKWVISPMLPPSCRYVPTCSEYAMEAVDRFGALRGGCMSLLRLLRCHPLAKGGFDPVPLREGHECAGCLIDSEPVPGGSVTRAVAGAEIRSAFPLTPSYLRTETEV